MPAPASTLRLLRPRPPLLPQPQLQHPPTASPRTRPARTPSLPRLAAGVHHTPTRRRPPGPVPCPARCPVPASNGPRPRPNLHPLAFTYSAFLVSTYDVFSPRRLGLVRRRAPPSVFADLSPCQAGLPRTLRSLLLHAIHAIRHRLHHDCLPSHRPHDHRLRFPRVCSTRYTPRAQSRLASASRLPSRPHMPTHIRPG